MKSSNTLQALKAPQQGFSLVMVMLLFVALTIVGLAVMRSGILAEKQATNIQEKSVTFHAAQSSNNGTVNTYLYNKDILDKAVDAAPLQADLSSHNQSYETCVDSEGTIAACDSTAYIDSKGGAVRGETETFYRACYTALKCLGTSADVYADNNVGCNIFEHDGTGYIDSQKNATADSDETVTEINQWSILVSACAKNV